LNQYCIARMTYIIRQTIVGLPGVDPVKISEWTYLLLADKMTWPGLLLTLCGGTHYCEREVVRHVTDMSQVTAQVKRSYTKR